MHSERLTYQPVAPAALDDLHRVIQDPHVFRYLLDGALMPRTWTAACIDDSVALYRSRGVGLDLVHEKSSGALIGFCGFLTMDPVPEPQLVYALLPAFTGRGYATEMARAAITQAFAKGFRQIEATVDEVNGASLRVLTKLGFAVTGSTPGEFGNMLLLRLPAL
jgi:RimJ/RimL family protein N-acetyltransferase